MTDKEFYESVPMASMYMAAVEAVYQALRQIEVDFFRKLLVALEKNYQSCQLHGENFDARTYWAVRQWLVRLLAELVEAREANNEEKAQ